MNGLGDCSIGVDGDVSGFRIDAGYTSTITQSSGFTMEVGLDDFKISNGYLVINGTFYIYDAVWGYVSGASRALASSRCGHTTATAESPATITIVQPQGI